MAGRSRRRETLTVLNSAAPSAPRCYGLWFVDPSVREPIMPNDVVAARRRKGRRRIIWGILLILVAATVWGVWRSSANANVGAEPSEGSDLLAGVSALITAIAGLITSVAGLVTILRSKRPSGDG